MSFGVGLEPNLNSGRLVGTISNFLNVTDSYDELLLILGGLSCVLVGLNGLPFFTVSRFSHSWIESTWTDDSRFKAFYSWLFLFGM